MAKTYLLTIGEEPVCKGTASDIADWLGCSIGVVYQRARRGSTGRDGGIVTVLSAEKEEPVVDSKKPWSQRDSELLAAMRARRVSETDEPRWEL